MKVHYRIQEYFIEIVRCFGTEPRVILPEQIEGYPVKRVAAYAFSSRKDKEDTDILVYEGAGEPLFVEQEKLLAGEAVEEVIFPDTVEEIGNYIFYGCKELKKLEFSDSLERIGSGAFTGCSNMGSLRVHLKHGERSCVKEILGDLWQRIDVIFEVQADGTDEIENREIYLVFPEHYEEAVENTPARILFTQHHGIGNHYRQCFYNREMDYRKYDSLFPLAAAQDDTDVLTDLIFGRLCCSYRLTREHEKMYEEYVIEHQREVAGYLTARDRLDLLSEISSRKLWKQEGLEDAIDAAAKNEKAEILSFLMNEKHLLFPEKKRKRFEL
ncbi:MAG: leucine-rich repeat domain-containing protein [Ruminococcus sp.]|nr:leucine-rich repeat domain-containing protein [Ruminococcus sp.]